MDSQEQLRKLIASHSDWPNWKIGEAMRPPIGESSVRRRLQRLGISRSKPASKPSPEEVEGKLAQLLQERLAEEGQKFLRDYASLPPVPKKIQAIHIKEMEVGEHKAVALFSDYHFGSEIDPRVTGGLAEYNMAIARDRLGKWRNAVLRFTQLQQVFCEVNELHLFALGDDFEGHGDMFDTQKLQMEESVFFQYVGFVIDMTEVLMSFLARYKKVYVHKVHGNHGRVAASAKGAYPPDNMELFAWREIQARCEAAAPGRFEFDISTSFWRMVELFGKFTFYIRHGHRIKGIGNTYVSALSNKLAMNSVVGEVINYMVKAHLHQSESMEAEIGGMIIQNGCFVGPSLLSVEGQKVAASLPSQEMFFVHPRHGLTDRHTLHLATPEEMRRNIEVWGRVKTS